MPVVRVPPDDEIEALHARLAPHRAAFDLVWTHCRIVAEIAEQVVSRVRGPVDERLVRAGSLLHDVGVHLLYRADGTLDHDRYLQHGVLGHDLLRDLGLPEALCRFCSCHTGVGITRRDVVEQRLPIPVGDYVPTSLEERVVLYADAFHSKTSPPQFVGAATYAARLARFGSDKVALFEGMVAELGEPDLRGLARSHGFAVV